MADKKFSDNIPATAPLTEDQKKEVQRLVNQGVPVGEAKKQVLSKTGVKATPTPTVAPKQTDSKLKYFKPLNNEVAKPTPIPIKYLTKAQELDRTTKPISFTGGWDSPSPEENYQRSIEQIRRDLSQPEQTKPETIPPAPTTLTKQEQPVPSVEKPKEEKSYVQWMQEMFDEKGYNKPATEVKKEEEDPYGLGMTNAKKSAGNIYGILNELPKDKIPNTTVTDLYSPTGEFFGKRVSRPAYPKTNVQITGKGPLTPEDAERMKGEAEKTREHYLNLAQEQRRSRTDLEERAGYAKRDYELGQGQAMRDLLANMDANRKRDMWDKLIEASGKVLSGVLGLTNLPFMPETKGLNIAQHYKHTPVFDRAAEDKFAQTKSEMQTKDLDKVYQESMQSLRPQITDAAKRESDILTEGEKQYIEMMKRAAGGDYTVQATQSTEPSSDKLDEAFKQPQQPTQGFVVDPRYFEAFNKERENRLKEAANGLVTGNSSWVKPGVMPKGLGLNQKELADIDAKKMRYLIEEVDNYFKASKEPTRQKLFEGIKNKAKDELKKTGKLDYVKYEREIGAIIPSTAQAKVYQTAAERLFSEYVNKIRSLNVTGNDPESVKNMQEAKSLFNFQGFPIDVLSNNKTVNQMPIGGAVPNQPGQSQQAGQGPAPEGLDENLTGFLLDEKGKRVYYNDPKNPPIAGPLSIKSFQNDERSNRDVKLLLSDKLQKNLNGPWKFTLDNEKFVPGIYSPTGTTTLIGPGIKTMHDQAASKSIQKHYTDFLKGDTSALERYKQESNTFFQKVLMAHDPFYNGSFQIDDVTKKYLKSHPNKAAVIRDLSWNGGPNHKSVSAMMKHLAAEASGDKKATPELGVKILKFYQAMPEGNEPYGQARANRRAAMWGSK